MRTILIGALLTVIACGNKKTEQAPSPPTDPEHPSPAVPEPVVMSAPSCASPLTAACHFTALEYFRVEMCRCKDKSCVDAVLRKHTDWSLKFQVGPKEEPSAEMNGKMIDSVKAYSDCMSKVLLPPESR